MLLDSGLLARLAEDAGLAPASIVVLPLSGGPAASVEPFGALYPASMIKVPLVAAALTDVERGRFSLETRFRVEARNMTATDSESPFVPGYVATLDDLMLAAIARSDNVATNMLFDIVGRGRATEIAFETFGLVGTVFARKLSGSEPLIEDPEWDGATRNAHPAGDAAMIMAAIAREEIPLAARLLDMLERQTWNEKLTPGLRDGDRFAHKTGDTSDVTHDGGILVTAEGSAYVVVAYTALASNEEHNARFSPFMREVRKYL